MLTKYFSFYKNIDWLMILPALFLTGLGLVEIYSISLSRSGGDLSSFKKQLIFAAIGLTAMIFLTSIDFYLFYSYSNILYLIGAILLVAVLFFGSEINNTKGWFSIFGLGIQPVELVKFILIVFLARYLSGESTAQKPVRNSLITGIGAFVLVTLVMLQPDLGSAALLIFIWIYILFISGLPKRYFLVLMAIFCFIFVIAWNFFLVGYQKDRISSFISPGTTLTADYNVNQAIIAVGAGGLNGRGLGFGSQSQLKFLPEAQTDFIFAVIAEELGLVGVMLVIALFVLLFWRIFKNMANIKNDFGSFLVLGIGGLIFIEMFINIGMNLGLSPVVGIALPFLSYGGSSLIVNLAMVGALQSVVVHSKIKQY